MMKNKFFWLSIVIAVFLSACVLPEKEDPFSKIPDEKIETIYGEIFPFSVSVSTRATHRLENENKLVALIASDIVRLDEFEGRIVEIDGVYRKEKMRPIFWVEAIRVKGLGENSAKSTSRFESTNYSFIKPENWESSLLEDEKTVHFLDKKDPNRKIFLTFSVKNIEELDKKSDPNIVIANMAGNKVSTSFDSGQIRQEITLFSNLFENKKYVFVFNNNSKDFSRKKDFFKLLDSFIEGEENVKLAHDEDLRKMAEKEEILVRNNENIVKSENGAEELEKNEKGDIISRIFGSEKEIDKTIEAVANENIEIKNKESELSEEFKNLIDNRAYYYESDYYGFSMKVPYGLWFKNFGRSSKNIAQVGFAKYELGGLDSSQFSLNIVEKENSISEKTESQENGILTIKFPRNNESFYEIKGSVEFVDYIRSIESSIKTM